MPDDPLKTCAYHVVRYQPNLIRDEWVNIGVLLFIPDGSPDAGPGSGPGEGFLKKPGAGRVRQRWLEEPGRQIHVESLEPPGRLVWWWGAEDEPATRVDFRILARPGGTRIVVTESSPSFPLASLRARFAMVAA